MMKLQMLEFKVIQIQSKSDKLIHSESIQLQSIQTQSNQIQTYS